MRAPRGCIAIVAELLEADPEAPENNTDRDKRPHPKILAAGYLPILSYPSSYARAQPRQINHRLTSCSPPVRHQSTCFDRHYSNRISLAP
jgi:hypothetical protein